jgi:hypothetical protein
MPLSGGRVTLHRMRINVQPTWLGSPLHYRHHARVILMIKTQWPHKPSSVRFHPCPSCICSLEHTGLQAFSLMYASGCLADPTTNAYCYVEAAVNTNPSDLYFYQLPLGMALPNSTTSTCSGCTKTLLALYDAALENATDLPNLSGLKSTYSGAARLADASCGQGYATLSASSSSTQSRPTPWLGAFLALLGCQWLFIP